jgi:hypothetical protein
MDDAFELKAVYPYVDLALFDKDQQDIIPEHLQEFTEKEWKEKMRGTIDVTKQSYWLHRISEILASSS